MDSSSMNGWIYGETLIDLCKAEIYKADSHKTDTFFVHQMKLSTKTILFKADAGLTAFQGPKTLRWFRISSPYTLS